MTVPSNDRPELLRTATPVVHAAFRLVTGFLFACHGAASLFGVLGGAHGGGTVPTLQWPGWWAAVIQLVGGGLVALGLFTRVSAAICSGSMAYAYFSVHQSNGLFPIVNGGELSVMFCWTFLLIAFLGPGAYAVETALRRRPVVRADDSATPVRAS
ncbi:DoxX family protein [Streptomyces sp. UH6]|uniref:DoxX family protein n=1 Tax=Streptomyces sp. UH6 TaxID=2748379 RepID=UPI0015D4A009|nr:DoxX family protein [Streptomyces sp. UH6]NYV74783.1 DoxX family protein [Streptomyces sp. UH6]